MIFNGISRAIEFQLLLFDRDEWELMTGFRTISEPYYNIGLKLEIGNLEVITSIFISDVKKMIDWFDSLLLNKLVEPKLLVLHSQLSFDLVQANSSFNIVRITYHGTIPVPGIGGRSGYIDESLLKDFVECRMNTNELKKIIIDLKSELHCSLESYK